LHPPPGYEPAWAPRNLDLPQYVTWIAALRTTTLLPNYHAPWLTEPAMFQPLFLLVSRIPLPPLAAYYVFSAALYICGGIALIYAATVFCPGLEWYALLASACAVPLGLLVFAFGKVFHWLPLLALGLFGIVDYSYSSADGLFRGGQGAALTLTTGTALMLLFMALLAKYVRDAQVSNLRAGSIPRLLAAVEGTSLTHKRPTKFPLSLSAILVVVSFAAAFFHPFEIFVMIAASAIPLWQCGRLRVWIGIAAAGLLGIAPYLIVSARSEWFRDLSHTLPFSMYPFWVPENFGIPFILLTYFLLIRFRMDDPCDRILQAWLLATIALALMNFTMAPHLFDGFAYCVGFLLVRRLATDRKLRPAIERHRRGVTWTIAALAALSAVSLVALYAQIWKDGRKAEPEWLLSAVRPVSERPLIDWLRSHATPDTLVLGPQAVAPWIATVPIHSFASHDIFDVSFTGHAKLADAFFRGDNVNHELLENYGVGIVVVPAGSPAIARLPAAAYRASVGTWRIYEFPEARMKPYPGIASIKPGLAPSLRARILDSLSRFLGH